MATTEDWQKDPNATLDWVFDWSSWLADGEEISTSEFIVSAGLTVEDGPLAPTHTTISATVWLSGGQTGQVYQVTNRVTTNQNRIDDRSIRIRVVNR